MKIEVLDRHSGAILFKKDEEGRTLDKLQEKVAAQEDTIKSLEKKIAELSKLVKK